MYSIGDYVWVEQGSIEVFNGCKIVNIDNNKVQVQDDNGKVDWITKDKIVKSIHGSSIAPVDDMIHLGDLQEYAILRNLHLRYRNQTIYTYIGNMLISINPYQVLNIYSMNEVSSYSKRSLETLPPHIFATSDKCFSTMRNTQQNQCILLSGESGAGKTESTKLILQYLTTISGGGHSWIKQQIIEANPILEAFGNAKTQKNDNSSRFGKYINIHFNKNGEIEGARINYYLLEKSRIVIQSKEERNYHIFYALLGGLTSDEKQKLYLGNLSDYKYLNGISACKDRNDAKTFADVKAAMQILHCDDNIFTNIIRLLATILHLGNLQYKSTTVAHTDATEIHDHTVTRISEFLGVDDKTLKNVLTRKCIFAKGEQVISYLSKNQAHKVRDAFAKLIYEKLFDKIVTEINNKLCSTNKCGKNSIGILDLSGFENFDTNSFEQLCINYANERLQQFFVKHIFKIEQELYNSEGISWTNIDFIDNQEIINMIGVKPLNIMSLIDEETIFPKGSDSTMLSKLCLIHKINPHFVKSKSNSTKEFGIAHYAGHVDYNVSGFLDKNRDTVSGDLKQLISKSTNYFFKNLFSPNEIIIKEDINRRLNTLSMDFRESLDSLLNTLQNCNPFFIRCIKPNEHKLPQVFDRSFCLRQLRYSGLMDTAKIRRAAYPLRYDYPAFVERFRPLVKGIELSHDANKRIITETICNKIFNDNDYLLGHSKIFLKDHHGDILEKQKSEALQVQALIIQKNFRMWIVRQRYLKIRNATITIQKTWRGYGPRKKFRKVRKAVLRLQARIRSRCHEAEFQKKRRTIILLQAQCRRYLVQKACEEKRKELKKMKMQVIRNKIEKTLKNSQQLNSEIDSTFEFLENEPKNHRKVSNEIFANMLTNGISDKSNEIIDPEIASYDFYKFAAIYFTGNATPYYVKKPLKQSLLDLPHLSDQLAAKALSITILRFMGDLSEPEIQVESYSNKTVMSTITESMSKNYQKIDHYNRFMNEDSQHFLRMTLKKKNKLNNVITKGIINDEYESWLNTERSNLEKLHFIIGHGILRPELKDEIYCQIVKQLTQNPSKNSRAKGWVLLMLCVGCFAPSDKFINYLKSFVKTDSSNYAPFCEKRLMRTYTNGSRIQPPCWIEMQSVKYNEPISLTVDLMDESTLKIEADSASTAQEIVNTLADSIKLKDTFGFSLFITIDDKVLSLSSEKDHVMDAISQCEQYAKELGHEERDAPWRLLFRKEIFSPWHDSMIDEVATNLTYHQICRGIKLGEYKCQNENDLATIIAQQLFVQYNSTTLPKNLRSILHSYVPNHLLQGDIERISYSLEKLTIKAFNQFHAIRDGDLIEAKDKVVSYGKNTWPLLFSKFYEVNKIFGPDFNLSELIIAVNSDGIYFIDDKENILQYFSFSHISEVNYHKNESTILHHLTISTIQREEFVFESSNAESFVSLVNYIMDGLKQQSMYVVAIQDYVNNGESEPTLTLKKGDIIKLTDGFTGNTIMSSLWGLGELHGIKGKFPCEYVYVLPSIKKPSAILTNIFNGDFTSKSTNVKLQEINHNAGESNYHTIQKFASENFRDGMKATIVSGSGISPIKSSISEELWKHTREPIKAPLLAKLLTKEKQFQQAIQIFTNILRYMGDLPSNRQRVGNELTDQIFGHALKDEILRDEVYCQIMRQLTNNKIRLSEERGWELMWLATGIMPCSPTVRKEVEQFLNSRNNVVSKDCLLRLNRIVKSETVRIYPPYILEIEAIRFKNLQIFHKVYFPDNTNVAFEVHSSSKALDICDEISRKWQLRGSDGFSLYFKISDRMISVPQYYFFFDFIREVFDWITRLRYKQSNETLQTNYQVLFMKKIWIDCLPGRDKNADTKFYFYQEASKYLHGYHKCTKKDAIELASLIYRSEHADSNEELSQIHRKLQEYIPSTMKDLMSPKEWKKRISSAYHQYKNLTQDDAKEQFLQRIYQWPNFGSAFFNVRQTTEPRFPEQVIIAINRSGVSIIDQNSKDILGLFSFMEITNWSSGDNYFHMTIGNFMNGKKILCETAFGYKMDDLISSYIQYLQGNVRGVSANKLYNRTLNEIVQNDIYFNLNRKQLREIQGKQ